MAITTLRWKLKLQMNRNEIKSEEKKFVQRDMTIKNWVWLCKTGGKNPI